MSGPFRKDDDIRPLDPMAAAAILLAWVSFVLLQKDGLAVSLSSLALVCAGFRGRVGLTRTHWLLFGLASLLICLGLFKASTSRAQLAGLVYPPLYPVALTLGLCTLPALLRQHTRREYWASVCLSALFLMLCGLNLAPLTGEFAVISAFWTCAFCLSTRCNLLGTRTPPAAWLTLLPGALLLTAIAFAYAFSEHQVNFLLRLLSSGGDVSLAFPPQSHMNTMASPDGNPAIVCRLFSEKPNRYLPARTYTDYDAASWREPGGSILVNGQPSGDEYRYQFSAQPALKRERFEVRSSPIVLFAPRDAVAIETSVPTLAQLSGHLLELRGGGNELTAYNVERRPDENMAPAESAEYLARCARPARVDPIVAATAHQVMGNGSLLERANRLENWLQDNFRYGFGHDWAASKDPVAELLRQKPKAHCEIFACAMALMLRSQGVPCRYVNGFAVVEKSWTGDYYVVRVRDAHAWCEVWDGHAWRTFDPTPPAALLRPSGWLDRFEAIKEALLYKLRSFTSGGWKDWLWALWSRRAWWGTLLLAFGLWKARKLPWFARLQRSAPPTVRQSEWIRQLQLRLGKHGLARESWETLQDWASRLSDWEHGEGLVAWLQGYSAFRYGAGSPQDEERLAQRLNTLLRELDALTDPRNRRA